MPHVVLTDRYTAAVAYASTIHAHQTRKGGDNTAYMAHLLGVSALVIEAGGDEDEAIAGLLHDAVEDAGGLPRLADISLRFGDTVASIVGACSDSTDAEWKRRTPYWQRKQAYLDHLEDPQTSGRAVMVSTADKVHNARATITDLRIHGPQALHKFNGTPGEVLTYYVECLRIAEDRQMPEVLLWPLYEAVVELDRAVMGEAR